METLNKRPEYEERCHIAGGSAKRRRFAVELQIESIDWSAVLKRRATERFHDAVVMDDTEDNSVCSFSGESLNPLVGTSACLSIVFQIFGPCLSHSLR